MQYYANGGCKTCTSLAGLVLTFLVVVIRALANEAVEFMRFIRFTVPCGEKVSVA